MSKFGISLSALCIIVMAYLRISNSFLTETQLLMRYWYVWAVCLILAMFGLYLYDRGGRWK